MVTGSSFVWEDVASWESKARDWLWLNRDLLVKLMNKKKKHRQWKQGKVSWEELLVCVGMESGSQGPA